MNCVTGFHVSMTNDTRMALHNSKIYICIINDMKDYQILEID